MTDKDLIQEARTEFPAEPRQDAALPWRGVKITPSENDVRERTMSKTYINPALPSMIRGLYRADLRERSIQNVLDLAADLVQELIDLRAAVPAETEWEYTDSESNPGEHHLTRFSGSRDALNRRNEGRKRGGHPALPIWKRRKAGPWEPVPGEEGESDE